MFTYINSLNLILLNDMLQKFLLILLLPLLLSFSLKAQITPPGLSDTRLAAWGAIGVAQNIGKRWTWNGYYGFATMSTTDNHALFSRPAMQIFNHEFQYKFSKRWQLSFCGSLRRQNEYDREAPYENATPAYRDEIRYYNRLHFKHSVGKRLSFTHSIRPEARFFLKPDGSPWSSPFQFRFRVKSNVNIPLNPESSNILIVANEVLMASSRQKSMGEQGYWGKFQLTENRAAIFFRHVFARPSMYLDIGVMQQMQINFSKKQYRHATYLGIDIILQNPFSKKDSEQKKSSHDDTHST